MASSSRASLLRESLIVGREGAGSTLFSGSIQDDGGGKSSSSSYPSTPSPTALYVLFWYAYVSALQSLLWMTFSSVPDDSRAWLTTDDQTLDLWLDWGPAAYCVAVPFALWLLSSRRDGLRLSVRLGAGLCCFASLLRCLPVVLSDEARAANSTAVLAAIHVAQFINGGVAPLVVCSPSLLSLLWFPEASRNTATAVANVASALGRAIGFFLGPALVSQPSDLATLLLVEAGLAALPVVATLIYYPAAPAVPPSRAAADEAAAMEAKEHAAHAEAAEFDYVGLDGFSSSSSSGKRGRGGGGRRAAVGCCSGAAASARTTAREIVAAARVPSFLLLALAGGLEMAVYGAWSGVLPSVLNPPFSDAQAGVFGSVNTFAGIVGGLLAGLITDIPALRHRLKGTVQVLAVLSAGFFAVLAASVSPYQQAALSGALGFWGLLAVCGAAGLLRGGTDPLFFELSAEAVAPAGVPAGAAGGVLTLWYHVILCAFLSVPPSFLQSYTMVGMAGLMLLSAVLLVPVRVAYTRR
jgi:MFS family permease